MEWRLCREFSGMADGRLRSLWCDGVLLEVYEFDHRKPRILGHAWIGQGNTRMDQWQLELLLPRRLSSRDAIVWETLLPAEDVTRWVAVDWDRKWIQLEPAAAVPDV